MFRHKYWKKGRSVVWPTPSGTCGRSKCDGRVHSDWASSELMLEFWPGYVFDPPLHREPCHLSAIHAASCVWAAPVPPAGHHIESYNSSKCRTGRTTSSCESRTASCLLQT